MEESPSEPSAAHPSKKTELSREEVIAARKLRKENKKKRKRIDEETGERPLPEDHHCAHWMSKKRRYCNLSPYAGSKYCPDHLSTVDGHKRIPCPIDPRHWIYESEKEGHIKNRCPGLVALGSDQPWYSKDFNAGEPDSDEENNEEEAPQAIPIEATSSEAATEETAQFVAIPEFQLKHRQQRASAISTMSNDLINDLLQRLEGIWSVYEPTVGSDLIVTEAPSVEGVTSALKIKHAVQNEAIMQHLRKADMWSAENLYIEWGCGNANLSQQIQQDLHSDHILVDRKTPKTKGDSKRDRSRLWKRIVIDIKDIDLSEVPELQPESDYSVAHPHSSICSFSKHLCGAATDLTIRGLEALNGVRNSGSVLIALCCHHRCSWQSYVGREFFEDTLGLTKEDFEVMVRMSSWATSGEHSDAPSAGSWGDVLTSEAKTLWGWRTKRILDVGRVKYLKKLGYETEFQYYVKPEISLENILMISKRAINADPTSKIATSSASSAPQAEETH